MTTTSRRISDQWHHWHAAVLCSGHPALLCFGLRNAWAQRAAMYVNYNFLVWLWRSLANCSMWDFELLTKSMYFGIFFLSVFHFTLFRWRTWHSMRKRHGRDRGSYFFAFASLLFFFCWLMGIITPLLQRCLNTRDDLQVLSSICFQQDTYRPAASTTLEEAHGWPLDPAQKVVRLLINDE